MLTRRQLLALGGSALAGAVGVVGYTIAIEPHWVELVRLPMRLPGLPRALHGATLLQLSDLHVGPRVSSAYLVETLREAAALEPDFVVVTGDFISYRSHDEIRELARVLRALPRGRRATVATLGNHDYGVAWRQVEVADEVANVATAAGVTVLRNAAIEFDGLQFAGLGDFWSPEWRSTAAPDTPAGGAVGALAALDRGKPTVVLCHNPDALDEAGWDDVRGWVLAGHTHGGQCKPPFLPPPLLPVRNRRYTAGTFDMGEGRTLYINRGLGHLIQVRFNARPEVTLFTLEAA